MKLGLGLGLDKGIVVASSPYGPELVTNGDFSNGSTGWIPVNSTPSVTDGVCRITSTAAYGRIATSFTCEIGKTYRVLGSAIAASISFRFFVGNSSGNGALISHPLRNPPFEMDETFVATQTTHWVTATINTANIGGWIEFDNVSVKEVL